MTTPDPTIVVGDIMAEHAPDFWSTLRAHPTPNLIQLGRPNHGRTLRPTLTGIPPVKTIPCHTHQEDA